MWLKKKENPSKKKLKKKNDHLSLVPFKLALIIKNDDFF